MSSSFHRFGAVMAVHCWVALASDAFPDKRPYLLTRYHGVAKFFHNTKIYIIFCMPTSCKSVGALRNAILIALTE